MTDTIQLMLRSFKASFLLEELSLVLKYNKLMYFIAHKLPDNNLLLV